MADWTDIDPNTLLPGEPWTSAKALASFENVSALAEGSVGAPQLRKVPLVISQTVITESPSTVDFFFDDTLYEEVSFSLANVKPTTNNQNLTIRLSDDGSTFVTSIGYRYAISANGVVTIGSSNTFVSPFIGSGNAATQDGMSGTVTLFQPGLSQATGGIFHLHTTGGDGSASLSHGAFSRSASIPTKGIRFYFFSGTMASGTITMYGVLKP